MRQKRRAIPAAERRQAAHQLLRQLHKLPQFLTAKRIAIYLPNDGEIDTQAVIQDLWRRKVEVFLPVLHPVRKGHLWFVHYTPNTRMKPNRYKIDEPDIRFQTRVSRRYLSVVCFPLVAFDAKGNRLGMGGGFYDRSFSFMTTQAFGPTLIGCAYQCQECDQLSSEDWDVPLAWIATEKQLINPL